MARSQFTFKFPNAQPGAAVTFSAAVYSSPADQTADGPTLALDLQRTVAVWTDATELTATWVDGSGASIAAEASLARPIVTATGGVPGAAPIAASGALTMANVPLVKFSESGTLTVPAGGSASPAWAFAATGEDYWGVPGSAQPLAITTAVADDTTLVYPDEANGAMYDLTAFLGGTANVLDAGKTLRISWSIWGLVGAQSEATIRADGSFHATASWVDATFKGDVGASFQPVVIESNLAHDASVTLAVVIITKRVGAAPPN